MPTFRRSISISPNGRSSNGVNRPRHPSIARRALRIIIQQAPIP
jgi:hypothetical protein